VCQFINNVYKTIDGVNLITSACDIHGAVSDFTSIFLKIASICIPTREVIIRNDDKVWFDLSIILIESVIKIGSSKE
jgi:hypothetical protein